MLAEGCRENADPGLAAVATRVIDLNPYRESAYRLLMLAAAARGDRAAAMLACRRCVEMLRDELGTEPSPETEAAKGAITGS